MRTFKQQLKHSLKEKSTDSDRKKGVGFIIKNNIQISDLIDLIHAEHPVNLRFSWLMGDLCEEKPEVVYPAITYLFSKRNEIKIKNFDRTLSKLFWLAGIPDEIEGDVIDQLFKWITDSKINVSTKNYALSALQFVVDIHPGLKAELKLVLEDQLDKNPISFRKKCLTIIESLH